jgi:cellulose synthase/poly-beta-1,6-N-acetylglucosamine synthase-like glycosyltransferase
MSGLNENRVNRLQRPCHRAGWAAKMALALAVAWAAMACPAQAAWVGAQGGAFGGGLGQAGGWGLLAGLLLLLALVALFALRQSLFLLNRLFGHQHQPFANVVSVDWPPVTVVLLAANHAASIEACLQGLLAADYPAQRLRVVAVTDHASDGTPALIDGMAQQYPGRLVAIHRNDPADFGAGAMASLRVATAQLQTDFVIVFDPSHQPSTGMVRRLMAPFCDPEVGAVTGRLLGRTDPRFAGGVAYGYPGAGLAARLTELERAGASQVGQRARANLGWVPHQAGVWGALRMRALQAVGGWPQEPAGAEEDLHVRLRQAGWLTVYQPQAELFDEPQNSWAAREAQLQALAHDQQMALRHQGLALLRSTGPGSGAATGLDNLLRLAGHWAAPLLLLAWALCLPLYFVAAPEISALVLMIVVLLSYVVMSNRSAFFEQAAAALLDRPRPHVRLLPLALLGFVGNALAALRGALGGSAVGHQYPDQFDDKGFEESRFEHRVHMVNMDSSGKPLGNPVGRPAGIPEQRP